MFLEQGNGAMGSSLAAWTTQQLILHTPYVPSVLAHAASDPRLLKLGPGRCPVEAIRGGQCCPALKRGLKDSPVL